MVTAGIRRFFLTALTAVPFLAWFWIYRAFFFDEAFIYGDNAQCYYYIKYYLDNIVHGVYPLWDPFSAWGRPDDLDMRFLGEFNPFLYTILMFQALGASFPLAFLLYLFGYFFLGIFGFFCLARRLFGSGRLAYLAGVLLTYSGLGVCFLQQMTILLIAVPGIWFFFFLVGLLKAPSRRDLAGLTFTTMVMVSTYMPFHFLTILGAVLIVSVAVYRREALSAIKRLGGFVWQYPWFVLVCAGSVILAALPAVQWMRDVGQPDYVLQMGREEPGRSAAGVALSAVNLSGLATENSLVEVLSDFDLGNQQFSYLSIFLLIVLGLSVVNPATPLALVLLGSGLLVFLIALADVTPVQAFLYRHVFFFRMFRNYFYFMPLLLPLWILFCLEQWRVWEQGWLSVSSMKARSARGVWIILVHAGFFALLARQEHVGASAYATGLASYGLLMAGLRRPRWRAWWKMGVVAVALIQPLAVMPAFYHHFGTKGDYPATREQAVFAFQRPAQGDALNAAHGFHWRTKVMRDASGFVREGFWGTRWAYRLHRLGGRPEVADYVRHKLVAYAHPPPQDILDLRGRPIREGDGLVEVARFTVNRLTLRTHFPERVFLVYNDSYHQRWRASVDGKAVALRRVNIAFKGLWGPAGDRVVDFRFGPAWREWFGWFLILFFGGWMLVVIRMSWSGDKTEASRGIQKNKGDQ